MTYGKILLFIFSFTFMPFLLQAQILQKSTHMFRHGDLIKRIQIETRNSLEKNENGVWDISQVEHTDKTIRQKYKCPTDTIPIIGAVEYNTRYYYPTDNDTLLMTAFENNLIRLDYDLPEVRMRFPVNKGDSIGGLFHATGTYCDKLRLRSFGHYSVVADDEGKLVCMNGDTLRHVIRLHTVRITAQKHFPMKILPTGIKEFSTDSIMFELQNDTILLREDIWRWYAPGYRYPILEAFTENYDISQTGSQPSVWYCSPEEQQLLPIDVENLQDRQWQTLYARTTPVDEYNESGSEQKSSGNLHYSVENNVEDKTLHISYRVDKTTQLRFILSDSSGIVYQSASRSDIVGTLDINYASLRRGQYIVYIYCNDNVVVEKFNVASY